MFHLTKWFSNFSGEATPTFSGEVHTLQSENLSKNNHTISILGTKGLSGDSLKKTAVFGSNAQINQTSISGSSSSKSSTTLTLGNNKRQSESYASRGKLELYGPNTYSTTLSYDDSESSFLSFPAAGTATSPAKLALLSEVTSVSNNLDALSSSVNTKLNGLTNLTTTHTNDISDINSALNIFTTTYATKAELEAEITKLLDGASPDALDGIKELAAALNNDDEYYQTVNNLLSTKVNITDFNSSISNLNDQKVNRSGDTMTGTLTAPRFESAITASDGKNINVYYYPTSYGNLYMALSQNNSVVNAMTLTPTYTRFNVPVEIYSGGTGANNAADARTNLGITPENIGAISKNGDMLSGNLDFYDNSFGLAWKLSDGTRIYLRPDVNANILQTVFVPTSGDSFSAFNIASDGTISFNKPLPIMSGGTGAKTAAEARTNLGITPDNINAVNKTGDTLTGDLSFNNRQNGIKWTTNDGTVFNLRPYPAGNLMQLTTKGTGTNNEENPSFNIGNDGSVWFGKPLPITSGGTGATDAAKARNNLGAFSKDGGTISGNVTINTAIDPYIYLANAGGGGDTLGLHWYGSETGSNTFGVYDGKNERHLLTISQAGYIEFFKPLPISSGGTGASDAETARANLGITPDNIGAVKKAGDTLTGDLNFNNRQNGIKWTTNDGTVFNLRPYPAGNLMQLTTKGTGTNNEENPSFNIGNDGSVWFGKPLPISSGGTGATTANGACTNIGAVKKSGDTMTGALSISNASYPALNFIDSDNNKTMASVVGNVNSGQLKFQNNATDTNYYAAYWLPKASTGLTANESYDILTTKQVVYSSTQPTYAAGKIWLKPV